MMKCTPRVRRLIAPITHAATAATAIAAGHASQAEVMKGIAHAMQQAETTNTLDVNMRVRITTDLNGPDGKLFPSNGREATITQKIGDRAWMVDLPVDPAAEPSDMVARVALIADWTELCAIEQEAV